MARLLSGLTVLAVGMIWGAVALTRGTDIVMPGIMVVTGGIIAAVEIARRRPGSIDD